MIQDILAQRLFQVGDERWPDKAFDFDRNFATRPLRRKEVFSAQVNV
jgi:hypothetical protein